MTEAAPLQTQATKGSASNNHSLLVQRKCACGGSSGLTGSCSECEKKKLLGHPLQTKLRISEPGDEYEQEADRVAEQVMRMQDPIFEEKNGRNNHAPLVQRKVNASRSGIDTAPRIVHDVLASPGQPLDAAARGFFEPRFMHNFAQVRVHATGQAAESARAINAEAYTVGTHVVLDNSNVKSESPEGRKLLAHELAHVVQQSEIPSRHRLARALAVPNERTERRQQRYDHRRRLRLKRFLRRVERRVGTESKMRPTRRRAARASAILCFAQAGDPEFVITDQVVRSFLENLVVEITGSAPDLSSCGVIEEPVLDVSEVDEVLEEQTETTEEEEKEEVGTDTDLGHEEVPPAEVIVSYEAPPPPTAMIRCGDWAIDIESWRPRILGSASEIAAAEGVELQEFSERAMRGDLWEQIKGYVQYLCNHPNFFANLAALIAAATLAALGLLGLLIIAATILELFNALMSGGLTALGIAAGVAAIATGLAAWLYRQLLGRPELPEQKPPSDERIPEKENPQEEEEKEEKEKKRRENLPCGEGEGYMPHTKVTTRHSNTRGLHVVADPLTRCKPADESVQWGTLPYRGSPKTGKHWPWGWNCISGGDASYNEKNYYTSVDNRRIRTKPSWNFRRVHLLHGPSARGVTRHLHGPGGERWNIIIGDNKINGSMQAAVEQHSKGAVAKVHDGQEVLYYEVRVTPWSESPYPAPYFAKEIVIKWGVRDFNDLSTPFRTVTHRFTSDPDLPPPRCDPTRPIEDEESEQEFNPPGTLSDGGDNAGLEVAAACDPAEKPFFLLAEWERGNLDDEFQRMEPSEFKYYNLEIAPPGPSEYKRQNLLVKDRLGRPFVGTVPVRFISLLPEDPAKPGAVPLAFVEMRGIPCLYDPSGRPIDLEPEADIDWPIGARRTTPVLSSPSGLGAGLTPRPVEPLD